MTAPATALRPATTPAGARRALRSPVARRLLANRAVVAGAVFLLVLVVLCLLAPLVARHDPADQHIVDRLQGPSTRYWLGTDGLGRDVFARLLYGGRVTLTAAVRGVGTAAVLGVPAGLIAGYAGRLPDRLLSWVADSLMSLPPLVLALTIIGIRGPGLANAMLAIGVVLSPRFFRVVRTSAMTIRQETYVEACLALGCAPTRILWRHVLPNASGPLLVQASFCVGYAVVAEASLSYLGLGVQDPTSSWGSMTRDAFQYISDSRWGVVPPSIAIAFTILASSLLGDGLRDAVSRTAAPQ
jgi:peptide/nickel transport system permease protein